MHGWVLANNGSLPAGPENHNLMEWIHKRGARGGRYAFTCEVDGDAASKQLGNDEWDGAHRPLQMRHSGPLRRACRSP